MLSVFSVDIPENLPSAPDPTTAALKGLAVWKRRSNNIDNVREKESAELSRRLSEFAKVVPKGVDIRNVNFGTGVKSGISYVATSCPRRRFADADADPSLKRVSCFFSGDLSLKHINEIHIDRHLHNQDDCHKIVHDYDTAKTFFSAFGSFAGDDFSQTTILRDALRKLQGPLAFVLYDEKEKRIVASRDKDGKEPLFWGTNAVGDLLMFSTDQLALCDSCEYVSEFPKGGVYISRPGKLTGSINGRSFKTTTEMMKGAKKIVRADSLTSLKSETNSQTDSLQVVTRRKSVFDCRSIQESINLLR